MKLWSMNPATGVERVIGRAPEPQGRPDSPSRDCAQFAKAPVWQVGEVAVISVDTVVMPYGTRPLFDLHPYPNHNASRVSRRKPPIATIMSGCTAVAPGKLDGAEGGVAPALALNPKKRSRLRRRPRASSFVGHHAASAKKNTLTVLRKQENAPSKVSSFDYFFRAPLA